MILIFSADSFLLGGGAFCNGQRIQVSATNQVINDKMIH